MAIPKLTSAGRVTRRYRPKVLFFGEMPHALKYQADLHTLGPE